MPFKVLFAEDYRVTLNAGDATAAHFMGRMAARRVESTREFLPPGGREEGREGVGQADELDVNTEHPDVHSPPEDQSERAAPPETFLSDSSLSEHSRPHRDNAPRLSHTSAACTRRTHRHTHTRAHFSVVIERLK